VSVVEDAVAAASAGAGRLILVTGPAGAGKTRLAAGLYADARRAGLRTAWVIAGRPGAPPLWPWFQLVSALPAELAERNPVPSAGVSADVRARFPMFEAVVALLAAATTAEPLLVVVDDLHEADPTSLLLLAHLAPRLHSMALVVIATVRTDVAPEVPEWAAVWPELVRQADTVPVPPLGPDEIAAVLAAGSQRPAPPELVGRVVARTGGNALFVCELARLLRTAPDDVDALPGTVRAVIDARLTRLSPACRRVLSAAAVLGTTRVAPEALLAVTGEQAEAVLSAQDEAVRHGILRAEQDGDIVFVHEIVRDAVYELLPLAHRTHWHQRAAEYHAAANRPADAAYHFRRAGPGRRPDAARWAEHAGHECMAVLAYEDAAAHFRTALDGAVDAGRVQVQLGAALLAAGDAIGARAAQLSAVAAARDRGDGALLADAALGLGAGAAGFEIALNDREQITGLEEALKLLDPADGTRRAAVLARLSIALTYTGNDERRAALAEEAVTLARRAGDATVLASALASWCDVIAGPEGVRDRLELATEIVELATERRELGLELLGRRLRLVAYHELGELGPVAQEISAYEHSARALRHPLYSWYVPLWRAAAAFAAGRMDECRTLVASARDQGEAAGSTNAAALVPTLLWFVAGESGDRQAIRDLFAKFGPDESMGPWVPITLALADAQLGNDAAARARLDAAMTVLDELPRDSEWLASLTQAAEAVALVGGHAIGERLYDLLAPFADVFVVEGIGAAPRGSVQRHLGLLAAARGDRATAAGHFERALEANRRLGATLVVARTLSDAATALADETLRAEAAAAYRTLGLQHRVDMLGAPTGASGAAAFIRTGEDWTLTYAGRTVTVRDSKGMRDLAVLLAVPGRPTPAVELVTTSTVVSGDLGEVADAQARRAYRDRLARLEHEQDEADRAGDAERSAALAAERDALIAQLGAAYGLGGRARRTGSTAERARSTVTARIKDSVRRIEAVHPELGRHLRHAVRTGTACSYEPETATAWQLTP
jgi:tetratricopeptide (TPR) repeat protein